MEKFFRVLGRLLSVIHHNDRNRTLARFKFSRSCSCNATGREGLVSKPVVRAFSGVQSSAMSNTACMPVRSITGQSNWPVNLPLGPREVSCPEVIEASVSMSFFAGELQGIESQNCLDLPSIVLIPLG